MRTGLLVRFFQDSPLEMKKRIEAFRLLLEIVIERIWFSLLFIDAKLYDRFCELEKKRYELDLEVDKLLRERDRLTVQIASGYIYFTSLSTE